MLFYIIANFDANSFISCFISEFFRRPEAFMMMQRLCKKDSLQQFVTTCGLDHISRAKLLLPDLTDLDFVFIILSTTHIPPFSKHCKISVSHFWRIPDAIKNVTFFITSRRIVLAHIVPPLQRRSSRNTFHPICINRRLMSLDNLSVLTHAGRTKKY